MIKGLITNFVTQIYCCISERLKSFTVRFWFHNLSLFVPFSCDFYIGYLVGLKCVGVQKHVHISCRPTVLFSLRYFVQL